MSEPGESTESREPIRVAATEAQEPAGLAALIREAEALHQTLTDARTRAVRLAAALRRHRRRERLVDATLASLRALKLQDVAGWAAARFPDVPPIHIQFDEEAKSCP